MTQNETYSDMTGTQVIYQDKTWRVSSYQVIEGRHTFLLIEPGERKPPYANWLRVPCEDVTIPPPPEPVELVEASPNGAKRTEAEK